MKSDSKKIFASHFTFYGKDGVALQSQELHQILRQSNWMIYECCSDLPEKKEGLFLSQLSYQNQKAIYLKSKIFSSIPLKDKDKIFSLLNKESLRIRNKIENYLRKNKIKTVHLHNFFSLPYHPAVTLGFWFLVKENPDILFISQNHDLIEEGREEIFPSPSCLQLKQLMEKIILPKFPNLVHTVLTKNTAFRLKRTKKIDALVIPDGFDFEMKPNKIKDFYKKTGLNKSDLLVGVSTRIVPRKAIEFAIQLTATLNRKRKLLEGKIIGPRRIKFDHQSKILLLLVQEEDKDGYYQSLVKLAQNLNVKMVNIGKKVISGFTRGPKLPFYDVYPYFDVFCYPTTQEGFGNQLLEGIVLARNLVPVVFEYPVYKQTISPFVPNIVSLGDKYKIHPDFPKLKILDQEVIEKASSEIIYYLLHPEIAEEKAKENFFLAKSEYDIRKITQKFIKIYKRKIF